MNKLTQIFLLTALVLSVAVAPLEAKGNKKKEDMTTIHLTKAEFLNKVYNIDANSSELIYKGDKPALVDFYASWCGPCKAIAPVLEELAKEYAGEIYIYKINTEEERDLAQAFNIRSIPTLLFIPMEGRPTMAKGAMSKEDLKKNIDKIMLQK